MIEAVTGGEPLVLLQPTERGPLDEVRDLVIRVAGAEVNVAIGLSRLDIGTGFLGAVGDDPLGRRVRKTLAGEQVDCSGLHRLSAPTGVFFKEWYGLGLDPNVYYYRHDSAGSRWAYDPAAWPLPDSARWLHTSGITPMVGHSPRDSAVTLARTLAARGAYHRRI